VSGKPQKVHLEWSSQQWKGEPLERFRAWAIQSKTNL
jgi:hypothetical protein